MLSKIITKLLIVDDIPENLLALDALIRGEGRQIFHAKSGEQALSLLLQHEFALAIIDIQMPGMNGFELAELMRGTEKTKNIPIVFVSAAGRELNYAFKGYETGAVDFLQKPLDVQAVTSKVAVFADLDRQRQAINIQVNALEKGRREQETLLSELRCTQEELKLAVRMRDDFMSIVSHELRTPLNGLILDNQLRKMHLESGNMQAFTADRLLAMNSRDERQITSLIRLIEDILDVSRIRTGKLSIRRAQVDLGDLTEQVLDRYSAQLNESGCTLSSDIATGVVGNWDAFRIEQVIINLLTNAMRYGAKKPIIVRVFADNQFAYLQVQDHGVGISEQDQQRIFGQFERVNTNQSAQGLGLGLFITEQIVTAHQGQISVASRQGEGAMFAVTLPLEASTSPSDS
ncbi:hybrid sensor histidine kinase/response regulator [Pseudomonas sp. M30-35]|uniref:hybrid sensor histidine kinase/response regulator n=1 Tax=Pseudomonas sp. M30-35 TaxID=1981174 RepID=UPI000B3C9D14|nr:hybrid sensor histidine kinase/response regulator [Pseudomonas sp. M30-35]ARU86528.1 hybrid sensor histidine kinase/response regulator [Pseudomonas sp. M30-35]